MRRESEIVGLEPERVEMDFLLEKWRRREQLPGKILIAGENGELVKAAKGIEDAKADVQASFSSPIYLEIVPNGIDKGAALIKLCSLYDVPVENTVSFGDQEPDIPLIRAAGIGVAMGNGIEKLKNSADMVTLSNDDSGIAAALEKLLWL